jgi:hypothetical protein
MRYTLPLQHLLRPLESQQSTSEDDTQYPKYASTHTLPIYNGVDGGRTACLSSLLLPTDINIYFLSEINIIELIFDNIINNQLKKYMSDKSADKNEER